MYINKASDGNIYTVTAIIISLFALLVSIISVFVTMAGIIDRALGVINFVSDWFFKDDNAQYFINVCNVIVAALGAFLIGKQKSLNYKIGNNDNFKSLAEVDYSDENLTNYVANIQNRVEKLIDQFKFHVIAFAISLICVYTAIILTPPPIKDVNLFRILTNLLNLSGGFFVYLIFLVLHDETIEDTNEENKKQASKVSIANYVSTNYWLVVAIVGFLYLLFYVCWTVANKDVSNIKENLNIFDLAAGLGVGMAMTLLFGRYVSIEQSIQATKLYSSVYKKLFSFIPVLSFETFIYLGITFILPVYALAQPLFGSFKINAFGNAESFQTWVFAICLIGKIWFFGITYFLLKKKLLHLYLYGVVSKIGNFPKLEHFLTSE